MAQFRQSVFGRLAGYEDVNDADRRGADPAMRWIVGGQALMGQAASTRQMGRFETEVLAKEANVTALADLSGRWIDVVHARRPTNVVVRDMDSSVSPTHGEQEGTAYNGHFGCTCYHPLFVFNQFGDLERCSLRSDNVHSADGWRDVLEPVVARYRGAAIKRRFCRGDAAFALRDLYDFLQGRGLKLRHPPQGQPGAPAPYRPSTQTPGGVTAEPCSAALCQLALSGRIIEPETAGCRQG